MPFRYNQQDASAVTRLGSMMNQVAVAQMQNRLRQAQLVQQGQYEGARLAQQQPYVDAGVSLRDAQTNKWNDDVTQNQWNRSNAEEAGNAAYGLRPQSNYGMPSVSAVSDLNHAILAKTLMQSIASNPQASQGFMQGRNVPQGDLQVNGLGEELGFNPMQPQPFTLGLGQTRYNADGSPLANAPFNILRGNEVVDINNNVLASGLPPNLAHQKASSAASIAQSMKEIKLNAAAGLYGKYNSNIADGGTNTIQLPGNIAESNFIGSLTRALQDTVLNQAPTNTPSSRFKVTQIK